MKTIPKKSFGSLKPKGDKKTSIDAIEETIGKPEIAVICPAAGRDLGDDYSKKVDLKKITELIFEEASTPRVRTKASKTKLTSVRLMTIFELLTDKSFPRKGPGKSTKVKILDAIIMAAIDKKLILQEEKDVKSKNH